MLHFLLLFPCGRNECLLNNCKGKFNWCNGDQLYMGHSECVATLLCILNMIPFTAGFGTIISGFISCCNGHKGSCCIVLMGFLQFLTMPLLCVGWIWSTRYGLKLYKPHLEEKKKSEDVTEAAAGLSGTAPVQVEEESKQVEMG